MSQENVETIRRCEAAMSRGENAESFGLFELVSTEFRDLGDRVLAFGTARVRGRESGAEVTHPMAVLVAFQDGEIIRIEDFGERDEALEVAGLSE